MVAGWVVYAVYTETAAGHALDGRVRTLQQQNQQLQQQLAERRQEIASAQSSAWLAEEARRLGYVMPGEKVYVLASPGAAVPPEGGIDASPIPGITPSPGASTPAATPPPGGATATPSPTPYELSVPPSH